RNSDALAVYRRLLDADPQHDDARLRMAAILVQLSQGDEALTHLEYLRSRHPGHADVPVRQAQAMDLLGRTAEARALLEETLRRQPDHAEALAECGRIALRAGDSEGAEEHLRLATRLDPGNGAARYQLFLALTKNRKEADAAREQEAIRQIEADVKRIKELIFEQLQRAPDDPAVHHEIALIALRAGQPAEALRWLQSALQV